MPSMNDNGTVQIAPRAYLHGFPKSGLHLAELFLSQVLRRLEGSNRFPWFGNVRDAWTCEFSENLDYLPKVLDVMPDRSYIKGHAMYSAKWARTLWENSVVSMFVYRDLRDVAVSQAHHVLDTRKNEDDGSDVLFHPGKAKYQALDTFEDVLYHVIIGLDEWPGLIQRWETFAPWLDERWVLPLRFEDLRYDRHETAKRILRYIAGQSAGFYGLNVTLDQDDVELGAVAMVASSCKTDQSATFRKGESGTWQEHWTPRIAAAFRDTGGDEWIERLEYEGVRAEVPS